MLQSGSPGRRAALFAPRQRSRCEAGARRSHFNAWSTMVSRSSNCGAQPSNARMRPESATMVADRPDAGRSM